MSGKKYTSPSVTHASRRHALTDTHIQYLALALHGALILYGEYQDAHAIVKYTDVDYRVFGDAVGALWGRGSGARAEGLMVRWMGWWVGDPYTRATYRYTPLLAVLLSPMHLPAPIGPISGKLLFSLLSALPIPRLLLRLARKERPGPNWLVHALWTLNPLILTIATRGSSESILVLLVLASLVALLDGRLRTCAILWGASVHWKIYPVIYASSIFVVLQRMDNGRFWTWRKVAFGLWAGGTMFGLSLVCWLIWGYPFIEHAFLYHASRLDHRHNFSAYFYPIYLQMFHRPSPPSAGLPALLGLADRIARHPLAAFVPQMSLSLGAGLLLPGADVAFTWFVQTVVFVTCNKVCTSQYFIWYLFFLPVVIPHLRISLGKGVLLLAVWTLSQALWLAIAYRLEFQAANVFLPLWLASLAFLVANCWCLGVVVDGYVVRKRVKGE